MAAPCIRCGACAEACPEGLAPADLLAAEGLGRLDLLAAGRLEDCTRCGACAPVCPSRLPLLATLARGQAALAGSDDAVAAAIARARARREAGRG